MRQLCHARPPDKPVCLALCIRWQALGGFWLAHVSPTEGLICLAGCDESVRNSLGLVIGASLAQPGEPVLHRLDAAGNLSMC